MIRVWNKDGKSFLVHSVDARELVQQGDHFEYDPRIGPEEDNTNSYLKYSDDQDIFKLDKDELIEFALEKFKAKLSVRWGEARLRSEIEKLRKEKQSLISPTLEDEDEDDEDDE